MSASSVQNRGTCGTPRPRCRCPREGAGHRRSRRSQRSSGPALSPHPALPARRRRAEKRGREPFIRLFTLPRPCGGGRVGAHGLHAARHARPRRPHRPRRGHHPLAQHERAARARALAAPLPERLQERALGLPSRARRGAEAAARRKTGAGSTCRSWASRGRRGKSGGRPVGLGGAAPPGRRRRDRRARASASRGRPGRDDPARRRLGRQAPDRRRAHRLPRDASTWSASGFRRSRGSSPTGAWAHFPFHHLAEFYADFGTYDVTLDVPSDFTIGATGPAVESASREAGASSGTCRGTSTTSPGRRGTGGSVRGRAIDGVDVTVLYPPGFGSVAQRELDALRFALPYFSARYGRYPYPVLTVVHPPGDAGEAGGMEYPTLITTGGPWWTPPGVLAPEIVTVHELGHQWFYGLVATNESAWPFLDEGINSVRRGRRDGEVARRRLDGRPGGPARERHRRGRRRGRVGRARRAGRPGGACDSRRARTTGGSSTSARRPSSRPCARLRRRGLRPRPRDVHAPVPLRAPGPRGAARGLRGTAGRARGAGASHGALREGLGRLRGRRCVLRGSDSAPRGSSTRTGKREKVEARQERRGGTTTRRCSSAARHARLPRRRRALVRGRDDAPRALGRRGRLGTPPVPRSLAASRRRRRPGPRLLLDDDLDNNHASAPEGARRAHHALERATYWAELSLELARARDPRNDGGRREPGTRSSSCANDAMRARTTPAPVARPVGVASGARRSAGVAGRGAVAAFSVRTRPATRRSGRTAASR